MKKCLLPLSLFITTVIQAQSPEDAIRYSFYPQNGTARNLAIGGAMGSLGGDINATFVNPAGLGFYKTKEFVLTGGYLFNNNKAQYREADSKSNQSTFAFGPSGFVFGAPSGQKGKSNAISVAITQTASFNNQVHYKGLNNYSSYSEQFAEEFAKSGLSIDEVLTSNSRFPYTAAPALYTYLIDTFSFVNSNGIRDTIVKGVPEYILDAGQAVQQEMNQTTRGGITEIALAFAHNSNDKWYWGATIGIPIIDYRSYTTFYENDTSANGANGFKQFEYTDDLKTSGVGFNAKMGVIYRPKEYIRIGLAIHTPTFMSLSDTRTTTLNTQLEKPYWPKDTTIYVSSQTFTYNQPGKSQYGQNTPFKAILSVSYVFREIEDVKKQKGFVTLDIEYVNHKGSKFSTDSEEPTEDDKTYYKELTKVVKAQYKGNVNFRLGGELKFNTIMGRLGFAYYGNPYKDADLKANHMLLSGGLGYRNKGVFIDLTYVHDICKNVDFPYRLEDRANTYATLKQQRGNIVATVGFKF